MKINKILGENSLMPIPSKILFFIFLFLVIILKPALAVECGSIPSDGCLISQNTVLVQGTYNLPNGMDFAADNVTLDCNGSVINGNGYLKQALYTNLYDNLVIKNCIIQNYYAGIQTNHIQSSGYGTVGTNITNNTIVNNTYGIWFRNSLDGSNVWNNTFINNNIFYPYTNYNTYCISGVGNTYINSYGPTCQGLYPYSNLLINSNATLAPGTYDITYGMDFAADGVILDCNGAILNGPGYLGQAFYTNYYKNIVIKNCVIQNYYAGIQTNQFAGYGTTGNITNNTLINNTYGVWLRNSLDYIGVFHNNFIDNTIHASSESSSNSFNISTGGDYWSNYDTSGEGCFDSNADLFCDDPYNISQENGSVINKDYLPFVVKDEWKISLHITDLIPIQVIKYVDMVKGKTTLIRVPVAFTAANPNGTIISNVTLYWNNTKIGVNDTTNLSSGQPKNFDFRYIPQNAGSDIEVRAEVRGVYQGANLTDTKTKMVNVVETRSLDLEFVSVDDPKDFENTALHIIEYINKIYPLKDNGINYVINRTNVNSLFYERNQFGIFLLTHRIYLSTLLTGKLPQRAIGILPSNWFNDALSMPGTKGLGYRFVSPGVLVEEDPIQVHYAAHELGHSYALCDEYDNSTWSGQDTIFGLCPNGDSDNNGHLDAACLPSGCLTSTLEPLSNLSDDSELTNIMSNRNINETWITKESYSWLLNIFKHSTPEFANSRIVISGKINKTTNTAKFDNFYKLDAGLAENVSELTGGNFSIEVYNANTLIYNISFNATFENIFFNGTTIETNESTFALTISFNQSTTHFVLKENGIIKDTRNVSTSAPQVSLISPQGNQTFSNAMINISWNGSDPDGDNLSYAVLLSPDNGTTYNTVVFDLNETNYSLSSNNLADSKNYLVKILATDGVNTNQSIINTSFEVDNDIKITQFNVVYLNQTQRIFKIAVNNTLNSTISNISWEFKTGESIKSSSILFNLQPKEEIFIYIYHNYSTTGNFTIFFKAFSGNFIETKTKDIIV